jgi:hypothetical protein
MRTARLAPAVAVAALVALGCQSPDVGQSCAIKWGTATADAPTPQTVTGDYLENGNPACDALVCIVSPASPAYPKYATCNGAQCGYCSKPCVSDQDCFTHDTGLVCRQMLLDPEIIKGLDAATLQRYLADLNYSSFCAVP